MAINQVEAGLKVSEDFLTSLDTFIQNQILHSWPDIIPGIDSIAQQLEGIVAKTETALRNAENIIKTQIEPLLQNAIPTAADFLGNLTRTLDDNLSNLISNLGTTEDVMAVFINALRAHSPGLAEWIYNNVAGSFGNVTLGILKEMERQDGEGIDMFLDGLLKMHQLPPWFAQMVKTFRGRGAEWQALALPALLVAALLSAISAATEPVATVVRQDSYNVFPVRVTPPETVIDLLNKGLIEDKHALNELLSSGFDVDPIRYMRDAHQERLNPEDSARLAFRGVINRATAIAEMRKHGLTEDYANWTWELTHQLLPEDAIRNAYLRGMFSISEHDSALEAHGYASERASLMRQLYFYIPPPADLIHMGIRNVFNPDIVERFTLDADKPTAFVQAAAQQGISEDWASKYWQAHWIMPGREAFFEMFQRTVDKPIDDHADKITLSDGSAVYNIMGRDTLNLALRDIDTPPFYRDKLTEVAYRPLTRIDIRRLAAVGLLTHAQIERAYLDLGYPQHRARQLADFTDALTARSKKDETAQLTDGLRRQVLRLYTANKLDMDAAKTALKEIGASPAEIAVYLAESDIVREAERAQAVEAGIGRLYVGGILTAKEATQHLQTAGVPVSAMGLLFNKWDLEIQYRGGTPHIHAHRELTKTEVVEALIDGLIDQPTAEKMLEDLGYEQVSADAEINLALYKSKRATKTAQVDAVKASYINGIIDELEASNRLDALYIPADQRDAYIATWTLQRETRTERIPIATLRDMVKGGYLTEPETLAHLKRHRFTDTDAQLLLSFWRQQKPPRGLVSVSGT